MKYLFLLLTYFAPLITLAQPGGGGDPGGGEPVPIQGIGFLLLAGAWLGFRKWAQKNKQ